MPSVKQPLGQVQLGVSLTTICAPQTTPNYAAQHIASIWIANTDTVARTFTLRVGSGVLTTANSIAEGMAIAAKTTYVFNEPMSLSAGQHFQGLADSAAKITVSVYGEEVS